MSSWEQVSVNKSGIGVPERFEVEEGLGLQIRWKWSRLVALIVGVFAIGWDSFLATWYYMATARSEPSLFQLLFPIGHVAVGLFLPYLALAFLFNETVVSVQEGEIKVRHRPLPFPGNRTLRAGEVKQLFCINQVKQKGSTSYTVMARLTSDREVTLITGLASDREARFLEQRIEGRLGLANQPVDGELPR